MADGLPFKTRILNHEILVGSFIKLTAHQAVEIAGLTGLDFIVVDAEHAPFSFESVDRCIVSGRAAGIPVLVRVPRSDSTMIQQCLDLGAAGIVVPHVSSQIAAEEVVKRTRLREGRRGYSNSPRAGDYGRLGMAEFIRRSDEGVTVIVQIEEPEGVAAAAAIASVDGVDGLFVGSADLAVAMGAGLADEEVRQAALIVAQSARAARKTCGTFLSDSARLKQQAAVGMNFFIVGSDQAAMRLGWETVVRDAAALRADFPG